MLCCYVNAQITHEQNNQEDEDFYRKLPSYSSDDSDDVVSAASHDDPIIPDPLDDLSVQLDDGIADDVLLDDDVAVLTTH